MLYLVYCTLAILVGYGQKVFSNPTSYDQRQTGDVNVQIHLKDVQVVALLDTELLDDYTDYDYAYDYADFTLKPISKPTTTPTVSTTTVKPWNTWPTKPSNLTATTSNHLVNETSKLNITTQDKSTISTISTIFTIPQESTTEKIDDISKIKENNETIVKLRINDKAGNELIDAEDIVKINEEKEVVSTMSEANLKKSCPVRYIMDNKGRCRHIKNRRRISLVPLTMRLGSRINEKGHFNVRKDLPIRIYKSGPKQ